ncbi:MAG: ABC transporter permease [Thermoplasmatales archaeon]|nr:ABC transporter permease [Thermoplasmatales archaeon]
MSHLGNIIKKEMKELLTPATILPIVIMAILFGSMGNVIGGIEEELNEKPVIGFINNDTGDLSKITTSVIEKYSDVVFNSTDLDDKQKALKDIKEEEGLALIIITKNFSSNILNDNPGQLEIYWIMEGAGILDSISSEVVQGVIYQINRELSEELIKNNSSINASIVLSPTQRLDTTYFKDKEMTGITPNAIVGLLSSQSTLIPIVIMMIILMSGGIVISSMALEKENKTLETLLTLPVKRTSIVTGKIVASASIGLFMALIYMIGFGNYMQSFQMSGGLNLADYGLSLSTFDLILVGISLFVTLIAGLALSMLLGTFAKNYKSAQTLTFPVTALALVPMFLTMFKDFDTLPIALKGFVYAIPFSHPMMAPRLLLFNNYTIVISGIIYVSIFAIILISYIAWIFKTDRLLTGSTRNFKKIFSRKKVK